MPQLWTPKSGESWRDWPPEAKLHLLKRLQKAAAVTLVLADVTTAQDLAAPRYEFRGANLELQTDRSPELLISGPAGTGKTLSALWKLHAACAHHPNVRCLIVRKTRASLTESVLVTYERDVLPPGCGISDGAGRANRHSYRYPNGSEIVAIGIDKPGRIMSSEFDRIYVPEAIELEENDWEFLTTRLRAQALPYTQLMADTNPDRPTHWLRRRCSGGATKMLHSQHRDNPSLWADGDWTPFGRTYLARLDALTGARRDRLRDGKWVQSEGVVYPEWQPAIHLVNRFVIPREWTRYWTIDLGYNNPFVCQFWAEDPDGLLVMYREIYMSGRIIEDHAKQILFICGAGGPRGWAEASEPRPRLILSDHAREDRETLHKHLRMGTVPARKEIIPGIQTVKARLRMGGNGKPRLVIFRDALHERDQALYDAKKPTCTADEFEAYIWNLADNRKHGEEPVDKDNHGMDACRYLVFFLDGKGGTQYRESKTPATTSVDEAPKGIWS